MDKIPLIHPLVILCLFYVGGLVLVALWPDTRRPRMKIPYHPRTEENP
jgi:hypothetical protein